jgi:hypothetical protein
MLTRPLRFTALLMLLAVGAVGNAAEVNVALDRWMYPFAFTGGTRDLSPTFGAAGVPGFDNRDAQFLIGFDTSATIPAGAGAANYQINSVTVRAAVGAGGGFEHDATYDSYRTYLPATDAEFQADADPGRPIELHGVGFRNGYTQFSFGANDNQPPGFEESSMFGTPDVGTRNAFALGYLTAGTGSDVSNSVSDRVESRPWAIGTASIAAGGVVPDNSTFAFAIDLTNPDVLSYLQSGLDEGALGFAITSLHEASQGGGGPPTPQFITRENAGAAAVPAVLDIDYQIIPEPAAVALALSSALFALPLFAVVRRRRRKS